MIREYDLDIVRIQEQEGAGRHYICLVSLGDLVVKSALACSSEDLGARLQINTTSITEAPDTPLSVSDLSPLEISYFREVVSRNAQYEPQRKVKADGV